MGHEYGIQQVREILLKLCKGITQHVRLSDANSELEIIEEDDVIPEHFKMIEKWKEDYMNRNKTFINKQGGMESLTIKS